MACGTSNGDVTLWCWDTRAVTREFRRKPAAGDDDEEEEDGEGGDKGGVAILSVHWSLDGRKIVAAKADGSVEVWDALEEDVSAVMTNVGLCSSVTFDASRPNGSTLVVSPSARPPFVRGTGVRGQKERELPSSHGDGNVPPGLAVSSKNGKYIFVGDAKGKVSVVKREDMTLVQSCDVPNATLVKRLELCRNGKHLLAVTNAPTLFGFDVDDSVETGDALTPRIEYASPSASRLQWGAAAYPWDGEFVYGATSGAAHEIHVWERETGELKCVLEGPAESKGIIQLAAHPVRDLGIALGVNGNLYVWARKYKEDWSAFDPKFETLMENVEYVEKEDEFDVKPKEETKPKQAMELRDDGEAIDLLRGAIELCYSDDTDDDVLHALPLRIKPNPEAVKYVEALQAKRERKAKRRRERQAAEEEAKAKAAEKSDGENGDA